MTLVSGINEELNKYSFQNNETEKFTKIIDKILVHHKEDIDGKTYQQVEIYYKLVGNLDRTAKNAA